jgi:methylglutaconyl-CoA hydratase
LEHLDGDEAGIAVISFSNQQQRNSLGKPTLALLQNHVQELNESKSVRCVIVRSTVPKIFCAGADLKERAAMPENQVADTVNNLRFSLGLLATIKVLPPPPRLSLQPPFTPSLFFVFGHEFTHH